MHPKQSIFSLLAIALMLMSALSYAADDEQDGMGIVHLTASAEKEVVNDLMVATLVVSEQDNDPAQLANKVNAKMGWALQRLKPIITVKHRTRSYNTRPIYDRKGAKVTGWRAEQSLEIESDDFKAAGKAIGLLQERLKMTSMRLSPKSSTRKEAEDQLIIEALNAFKARAELVAMNFGVASYELVNVHVNTHSNFQHPNVERYETARVSADSWPAVAGGTSTVNVQIQGSIKLQP